VTRDIFKEKGILGFYKGISASYVGISETAIYFVIYEKLKHLSTVAYNSNSATTNFPFFSYITSAGLSKTFASIICYPHGKFASIGHVCCPLLFDNPFQ
jgi:solute carrier family 25 protein 33/36